MRRKSERAASKKAKASPEKKVEKAKRTRTRRSRKQSTSSDNDSDKGSPVREVETVEETVKEVPTTPVKEDSPEDAPDQVWQVKTAEGSGDVGEIQKLKICLTRPPSTPERVDRSPRSKRKHSRATSSSDTPSTEGTDEKRKSRRSKRNRESRDESDKNHDSQEEPDVDTESTVEKTENEISQSTEAKQVSTSDETPMSTTNEEAKVEESETKEVPQKEETSGETESQNKSSDADTTVASPKNEALNDQSDVITTEKESAEQQRADSVEKSEVLEIHADESKIESSESQLNKQEEGSSQEDEGSNSKQHQDRASTDREVSITQDITEQSVSDGLKSASEDTAKSTNETDVLESSENDAKKKARKISVDSNKDKDESVESNRNRELERSESTQSTEEGIHNGQAAPIVISRKRKWGSRPKITTQKSITISTDVLKEIIPDVKPVEFDEVIEEKKHKRIEVTEKIHRPVLPKIVIDNTENVEMNNKDHDNKEKENIKSRESNLSTNRRISIVKDNDSIITRPPSPPRHKQSSILYITNLVRPFTLPQLKNLLQRTGKIVENGFWIDRIKSKCFVQYDNEDQAVETRHALHGVTWPVSNPKTLQVDFSSEEAFEKARSSEEAEGVPTSTIPGTVEDWLREQDLKRERGELDKPWERKAAMREWDVGKNDKDNKEKDMRPRKDERPLDKRRHRSQERSPEPARKFKKKEEEAPAKLLDDLFRKTKTTPCIYWLPLSAETIAIKEEQRRQHMAEHERRMQELRRPQPRRH
uniref:RRM domain-containing protein n=2 Tax=Pectinophora gossypiella TaxID=13191 RepID=A0A1E1WU44_PECGO